MDIGLSTALANAATPEEFQLLVNEHRLSWFIYRHLTAEYCNVKFIYVDSPDEYFTVKMNKACLL